MLVHNEQSVCGKLALLGIALKLSWLANVNWHISLIDKPHYYCLYYYSVPICKYINIWLLGFSRLSEDQTNKTVFTPDHVLWLYGRFVHLHVKESNTSTAVYTHDQGYTYLLRSGTISFALDGKTKPHGICLRSIYGCITNANRNTKRSTDHLCGHLVRILHQYWKNYYTNLYPDLNLDSKLWCFVNQFNVKSFQLRLHQSGTGVPYIREDTGLKCTASNWIWFNMV